jgi:hypothetical protein
MLSNRVILLFFSLVSMQVCAMECNGVNIVPNIENDVQEKQVFLNSINVKFKDSSPYQKVDLIILGHKITLERQNNNEYVFEQRLLIDPTKKLRVSYDLFPGETNLGIMMIDKSKLKVNSVYDLHVDIGDSGAYALKINLKKNN